MLDKLALLLKSKIALAAIGATLVAGGGATVAAAATGAQVPVVSQALHAATGTHDANDDNGKDAAGHDANDDKGQDANDQDNANEHEAQGTVSSVDASGSSFVVKESGGASVTVKVSASTIFDGGLTKLGDLKAGMTVEVKGATQADGTVAASRVHGEDANGTQGDDHGGDSHGGSGGSGSGGSGSSSGSDDHGGNG